MRRSRQWVKEVCKQGFADITAEGRFWVEMRFYHRETGMMVHRKTVTYTN